MKYIDDKEEKNHTYIVQTLHNRRRERSFFLSRCTIDIFILVQELLNNFVKLWLPFAANRDKDTDKNEVSKVTFTPKLKSFEQDIMDQMGIKEDRQYRKSFWYWVVENIQSDGFFM